MEHGMKWSTSKVKTRKSHRDSTGWTALGLIRNNIIKLAPTWCYFFSRPKYNPLFLLLCSRGDPPSKIKGRGTNFADQYIGSLCIFKWNIFIFKIYWWWYYWCSNRAEVGCENSWQAPEGLSCLREWKVIKIIILGEWLSQDRCPLEIKTPVIIHECCW